MTLQQTDFSIFSSLQQAPEKFDFFQAVRLITAAFGKKSIVFDNPLEMVFSPSMIERIKPEENDRFKMAISFFGLYGPHGVLEEDFFQQIEDEENNGTLKSFLDLFNHHFIALRYLAWQKNKIFDDKLTYKKIILNIMGILPDTVFWEFEGLISFPCFFNSAHPTAADLKKVLSFYFKVPVEIIEFKPKWVSLRPEQCSYLGAHAPMNRLGLETLLGKQLRQVHDRFALVVGPIDYPTYETFLPHTPARTLLDRLIQQYIQSEYDYEIQFLLKTESIPQLKLSRDGKTKLAWNTWCRGINLVPRRGLEPPQCYLQVPETCVSTNFTTSA